MWLPGKHGPVKGSGCQESKWDLRLLWMKMLSPKQSLLFSVLTSNWKPPLCLDTALLERFNRLETAQGSLYWGVKDLNVIEKLKKQGVFFRRRKGLRLIINIFKHSSCSLKTKEVDLFGVNTEGKTMTNGWKLYKRKFPHNRNKFLTWELPHKCYKVWREVWVL